MATKIFFTADDLGMSEPVNQAIFHTHRNGRLDAASLMMGQPGSAEAIEQARDLPHLAIGLHWHFANSQPLTRPSWPWGDSPVRAGFAIGTSRRARQLVHDEARAQWDAFAATGLRLSFANAHHHLHVHPLLRECLGALLSRVPGIWVRWGKARLFRNTWLERCAPAWRCPWPVEATDTLWGVDRTFRMRSAEVRAAIARLGPGFHEFMFHPRRIQDDADTACLIELRAP